LRGRLEVDGSDRPCRARPADPLRVAEDRSAAGVHDRTGPNPPGPPWVRVTKVEHRHERSPTVAHGSEEPQVAGPSAQAAGITQTGDSDCGPEGHRASRWTLTCRRPECVDGRISRPAAGRRPRAGTVAQAAVTLASRSGHDAG
jgi:hypothetical protein